ncbi:MAG: zinc-dependent metalloprotease [Bdellovibrionota bacterium]|nr:zinc-dependent metalloprotease [Bdellovibrionota bacterium]
MFKSKSEKEKLMTKALKSIGMALTVSSILVGCAKDLPEKETTEVEENVFSSQSIVSAKYTIETVSPTDALQGTESVEAIEAENAQAGVSALSYTRYFKTKVISSNTKELDPLFQGLEIEATKAGEQFEVTFKVTDGFIVAYATPLTSSMNQLASERDDLLPSNFSAINKVPLFQYEVDAFGITQRKLNDLDEETRTIEFRETNRDTATHVKFNPIVENRVMSGLLGIDVDQRNTIFKKDQIESQVWTVARARRLLGDEKSLIKSEQFSEYVFKDNDKLKLDIDDGQLLVRRLVGKDDLDTIEKNIIKVGRFDYRFIPCTTEFAKKVQREKDNCFLRTEFIKDVSSVTLKYDIDQGDGSFLAKTVINPTKNHDSTNLIQIATGEKATEIFASRKIESFNSQGNVWLPLEVFDNKEFMMRRVLEDSPNVFNYTFAGSAGGWTVEMVKFEFNKDTLVIKKSTPTLSKTGTTDVDKEVLMSFNISYYRELLFDDLGKKLEVPKYLKSSHDDPQAFGVINLKYNQAPRISSPIDFYGLQACFSGEITNEREVLDIATEADGFKDLLNYTVKSTFIASPHVDCAGVRYSDLANRNLTFKERVSFKRYYGGDENPPQAIPYDLQKKFNFGIFTGEKTVPKGYSEQINSFDSTVSLPMVYDIRNGKTITYVLAGIPAANGETGRVLTKAEKDLREKLISSSKRVVGDINKGFEKAFKGTPYEGRGEIIKLKIERDDSMPAGVRQFNGLEVVEKGHIGDMNRNYIYWIEKGTSLGIIGLGGPHSNPRNGFVESASVYLYGGNMKSSIDWMVDQAKSEKKYLDNMNASRRLVYYKDQAPQADATPADNGSADANGADDATDTSETDTQAADAAANNAADARAFAEVFKSMSQEEIMSHLSHDSGAIKAISSMKSKIKRGHNPFNVIKDTLKVDVNSSQFKDAIRDLHEVSKEGYGIKTPTEELDLEKMFKSEKALDKTLKMLSIHNHFKKHFPETDELNAKSVIANDRDVELAEIIHGKDSKEANAERILAKLNWTKRDGKSDLKNPICVHRKSEYVLSKLAQSYDVVEKAKTDEGKNDILIDIWMPTLAHEIGHNLGLRHNFIGSFDKKNWRFISGDENATRTSSSIMDYQTDDHITYDGLGPYDVYALRAAYTGYIPLEKLADAPSESVSVAGATLPVRNAEHKTAAGTKYEQLVKITDVIDAIGKENIKNISRDDIKRFGLKKIKFCTDEDAGESPQCNRHDAGASFQEIVDNTIHDYRKLYDFIYFPGKRKDFYLGGPIGWLLGKFMKLRQLNEELWFQFIYERDNYTEEEWNVLITDMIGAVETSLDFLRSVVTMPEAPSYVSGPNKAERFIPTGITYEKNVAGIPIKKNEVIMVETKWTEGRTFDSQDFRAMFRGTEYDKVAAIMALTADRSNSYRYLKHSLRIPYTLLEKFIFRRESYDSLVLKTLQEVLLDDVTPKVLVDHNLYSPEKAPDYTLVELDKKMFKSEVNEFIRNYAIFGAMYFLNIQTYEPSFNPSRAFRIEGKNEDELKVINPETGALENFVQIIGGDQVFVPYADDSYMASELIAKGDILRDISELETMLQSKKELYDQIGPFLQNAPASPDYDQAQMDQLTAAVPGLIAEGKRNELINTYVALVQLHKNRLTQGSPEEQAKAEAFLKELTADKFANDLFRKDYAELISKVGFDPKEVSIEVLEGAALRNAFEKIAVAEKCKADKSTCPSVLKNTLQGVKRSRHNAMIEEYTKNELNSWGVATIANNRVNLAELVFSTVLANIDLGEKTGNPAFNAYAPTRSASSSHDRIKGNVSELSNIFFMLNPQENR